MSLRKKILVKQSTKINDWVLDPFGSSGKILQACRELKRKCHILDISEESVEKHMVHLLT